MQAFVRGALTVFTVVIALRLLHLGESGVGVLTAAVGVGGVIGAVGAGLLTDSHRLAAWFGGGVGLWSAPLIVAGLWMTRASALAMLALIGVANAIVDATAYSLVPRTVDDAVLARVFGALFALIYAAMALGAAVVPLLITLLGSEGALIVVGLVLPILVVLAWRRLSSIDRGIERRDEVIALLRRVSFLRLLPMAGMEYLSGGLESVHIPAGSVLFSQGDPGDCYYVVASGDVDVVRDGVQVARLGAGDGFGEMALLHDRPRAATIRAGSELDLRVLARERFVTTISRCNASMQAATSLTAGYRRPSPTSADRSE
jgi:MFS family permease